MKAIGVIPARYGSRRFPGKPLADLCGKPMIQHVWEGTHQAQRLSRLIVATDDERIHNAVLTFGGDAVLTRKDHPSGTDRVSEVVADMETDIVVNIQGDEPFIEGRMIDELVSAFDADPDLQMATLATHLNKNRNETDPNTTNVVVDKNGFALYFSRWPIPYVRQGRPDSTWPGFLRHIGIYGFRKNFLLMFASLDPTPLEEIEGLEQLRALEHGFRIKVIETNHRPINVDTIEDLKRVRAMMRDRRNF